MVPFADSAGEPGSSGSVADSTWGRTCAEHTTARVATGEHSHEHEGPDHDDADGVRRRCGRDGRDETYALLRRRAG